MELARSLPVREPYGPGYPDRWNLFVKRCYYKKEVFRVIHLNVKNDMIMKEDISVGGLHSAAAHPREVFQTAIKKGAHAVILIHNHPSGDPTPSQSDKTTTGQLVKAGSILGIQVLDHIVIGDGHYVSFKQQGIL